MTKLTTDRIKNAALNSFAEFGYHATSMRQLAEVAKVQAGSLYHWYPNKEALLASIMDDFLGGLAREVVAEVEQRSSPTERLAVAIRTHVIYHGLHRRAAFVTDTEVRALTGPQKKRIMDVRDSYAELIHQLIRDGIEVGQFHSRNSKIATLAILLQCTGVAVWFDPSGPLSLTEIAGIHVDLVLNSLQAGPVSEPLLTKSA